MRRFIEPFLDTTDEEAHVAKFPEKKDEMTPLTTISQEVHMQKLIVVAFTALCMIGVSSLVMADETVQRATDAMKSDIKTETDSMKTDMKSKKEEVKGKMKARKEAMKAKKQEMKKKAKAKKEKMKRIGEEAKADGQSLGQDMKATGQEMKTIVPMVPAPEAASAPAAGH